MPLGYMTLMTKAEGRTSTYSGPIARVGMILWRKEHPKNMPHVGVCEGLPVEDPKHLRIVQAHVLSCTKIIVGVDMFIS